VPFHVRQIAEFVDAVRAGHEPAVTGREATKSLAILTALYASARSGRPERVPSSRRPAHEPHDSPDRHRPPHPAAARAAGARDRRRGGGYDFVGIRVKAVTDGERQYPMEPGSPMSKETLPSLDDTGLTVRDVEFLTLRPDTGPDDWWPALEAGAALGASTFSVVGVDPDRGRLTDTLARLTDDGAEFGIRPTLEPISYQPVSRVADAAVIARAAGAAVLVDALHCAARGLVPGRRPGPGAGPRAVHPALRRSAGPARGRWSYPTSCRSG
jgi:hypothetical protein